MYIAFYFPKKLNIFKKQIVTVTNFLIDVIFYTYVYKFVLIYCFYKISH